MQVAAICLPSLQESGVLGEVSVVKAHSAANKVTRAGAGVLAGVELLHLAVTRLVHHILVGVVGPDRARAFVPQPSRVQHGPFD